MYPIIFGFFDDKLKSKAQRKVQNTSGSGAITTIITRCLPRNRPGPLTASLIRTRDSLMPINLCPRIKTVKSKKSTIGKVFMSCRISHVANGDRDGKITSQLGDDAVAALTRTTSWSLRRITRNSRGISHC